MLAVSAPLPGAQVATRQAGVTTAMSVGAIGSFYSSAANGHYGAVVSRQTVAQLPDGTEVVRAQVRTGGAQGVAPATAGGIQQGQDCEDCSSSAAFKTDQQLTPQEKALVERLRQRDAAVRREEEAHADAAGKLGGPPQYTYTRGPDGRLYATGGSVKVNAVSTGDPDEARKLASRIAAAAEAPVRPSGADHAAAANAYHLAVQAQSIGGSGGAGRAENALDLLV